MSEQISQYLRISAPSSTAVKYTVSSSARRPAKAITVFRHTLRVVVAFYALLALVAKLELTFSAGLSFSTNIVLNLALFSGVLKVVIHSLEWWVLLVTSLLTVYVCIQRGHIGW